MESYGLEWNRHRFEKLSTSTITKLCHGGKQSQDKGREMKYREVNCPVPMVLRDIRWDVKTDVVKSSL